MLTRTKLLGIHCVTACLGVALHGEPLFIGSGATMRFGSQTQSTVASYDSIAIDPGGTMEVIGEVTFNVSGDIQVNGKIAFPQPTFKKANDGKDGMSGPEGLENQPTGGNSGGGGLLANRGDDWTDGSTVHRLNLNGRRTVLINGTIELEPEFSGGNSGVGGKGGKGGSGISGPAAGQGGFAGQAGGGNQGGHAGLTGANLRIAGERIELRPNARISLDNHGSGGQGGKGGSGGNGGRGGDGPTGAPGGGGGPAGPGGRGGMGGSGGNLTLTADVLLLEGEISATGGPGGDGGDVGTPGNGGAAGNSTEQGRPGPRGGDAGNPGGSGPRGGNGGPGGTGGTVFINARQELTLRSRLVLEGGEGGQGGAGLPAVKSLGGQGGGGSPAGDRGLDSGRLEEGAPGAQGLRGFVSVRSAFDTGEEWQFPGPFDCTGPFVETDSKQVTRRGWKLCGQTCISRFANTGQDHPLELRFEYRWLSTVGTLVFSLGEHVIHTLSAPSVLNSDFQEVRVILSDPALRSPFGQSFKVCLSPEAAQVQLVNLILRSAPEAEGPTVTVRLDSGGAGIQFGWTSVTGQIYQLQSRGSLAAGSWTDLGAPIPGTGQPASASAAIAAGQPQGFYRIRMAPAP